MKQIWSVCKVKRKTWFVAPAVLLISVIMFSLCACDKEPQNVDYSFKDLKITENPAWELTENIVMSYNGASDEKKPEFLKMYTMQTNCNGVFDVDAIGSEKPEGGVIYSEVYAFKAPSSGCYAFDIRYNIGGEEGVGDVVTLSVYADT